ncbi:hypothetical protein SLEP1_g30874 [Rubroshorea leprosula]|uniref:Uncharacterized protein n=1 Tax=Rubroshorea leprosula TaxID=152421 RepID=A0AAV5K7W8_9ROSI|nr:hypothetical protein SLEP1_g30874 [Rubroshorea leprosula]
MGSEYKRNYDITMSKRTRKPLNLEDAPHASIVNANGSPPSPPKVVQDEDNERRSLKQLINGDWKATEETSGEESRGRSSLGHHFTQEEKQLQVQVVKKQHQDGKFKGMMSRYAKVLRHMIKVKREPRIGSQKKHLLRLTMQG